MHCKFNLTAAAVFFLFVEEMLGWLTHVVAGGVNNTCD
jgi:hypothetical protein